MNTDRFAPPEDVRQQFADAFRQDWNYEIQRANGAVFLHVNVGRDKTAVALVSFALEPSATDRQIEDAWQQLARAACKPGGR